MKNKPNYLSEVLTALDIKQMATNKQRDGITLIVSPTGTGKSKFIIEKFVKPLFENENHGFGESGQYQSNSNEKILILANRTAVVVKTKADIETAEREMGIAKAEGVNVNSYQKIADTELIKMVDEADFIVCDEAHYFISDAWNNITKVLFNKVLEAAEKKPVVFFTATPELVFEYFSYYAIPHTEYNYTDILGFYDRMNFVATNKDLEQIIRDIPLGEKWLAFEEDTKSKKLLVNRAERLNEAGYTVTPYHSQWLMNQDGTFTGRKDTIMAKRLRMLVGMKRFETTGAIANKALDNGIDIIDGNFRHIILINQFDHVQIKQMIGRKRFNVNDSEDRLTVWFTTDGNSTLEKMYEKLLTKVNLYNKYREHHFKNHGFTENFVMNPNNPLSVGKTTEELRSMINDTIYASFINNGDNLEEIEKAKLSKELLQNEEYGGLIRFQLKFIRPLVTQVMYEQDSDGKIELITKPNTVQNYQQLVKQLFNKNAEIQWRNKDIAFEQQKLELKQRFENELPHY